MSARYHAVVWIDHNEAEISRINEGEDVSVHVNSHESVQRMHQREGADGGHAAADTNFYRRIVAVLNHASGILLAGPGEAKFELLRYIDAERPDLATHVHEVETDPHPGHKRLIEIARQYFRAAA
jgi:stalled ribosome rescue protein Dom34